MLEVGDDRSSYYFALVATGACGLGWIGLLIFYFIAPRFVAPERFGRAKERHFPWWTVTTLAVVALLVAGGFALHRFSRQMEGEFVLLREGDLQTLEQRIRQNPGLLEKPEGRSGAMLVQVAYRENLPEALELLFSLGASRESLSGAGGNPLSAALDKLPMLGTLLKAGFDPNKPDARGLPPLHYAVSLRLSDAAGLLLKNGADVDVRDNLFRTPLMRAIEGDDLPMAGILMEHGADVNAFDRRGDTALHRAVRKRNPESLRLLLKNGADPKKFNFNHMTPLHIAAQGGHDELVSIFLEQPGMTNLCDESDHTPFEYALMSRHYETAELLLDAGADLNRILAKGGTTLHEVIRVRDYAAARFLINHGADVYIPNAAGETVHDVLRRKQLAGLLEMVERRDHPEAFTNETEQVEGELPPATP